MVENWSPGRGLGRDVDRHGVPEHRVRRVTRSRTRSAHPVQAGTAAGRNRVLTRRRRGARSSSRHGARLSAGADRGQVSVVGLEAWAPERKRRAGRCRPRERSRLRTGSVPARSRCRRDPAPAVIRTPSPSVGVDHVGPAQRAPALANGSPVSRPRTLGRSFSGETAAKGKRYSRPRGSAKSFSGLVSTARCCGCWGIRRPNRFCVCSPPPQGRRCVPAPALRGLRP